MKRYAAVAAVFLMLLSAGACKQKSTANNANAPSPSAQQSNMTPEKLGEIGAKIKKNPKKMDEILASYGLDEKRFESEIRKTTQSPDASKRYAAAYKTASK